LGSDPNVFSLLLTYRLIEGHMIKEGVSIIEQAIVGGGEIVLKLVNS